MSKSSSGKAGFFAEAFDDEAEALVDDDAVAAAGALLFPPPFPFFAILMGRYATPSTSFLIAELHGICGEKARWLNSDLRRVVNSK